MSRNKRLCDFWGDGKEAYCLRPAEYSVKNKKRGSPIHDLCKFHFGFIMSVDYSNEQKIVRRPKK